MSAMSNAPETLDGYQTDLARALKLIDARNPGYVKAWEYYNGTRAEVSASKAVESIIAKTAQAAPIALAHIPVDVVADKVALASLGSPDSGAAIAIETVAERNEIDDEADDWVRKACAYGDYYVVVDPRAEAESGDIMLDAIDWVAVSPLNTVMVYDRQNQRTALYGCRVWRGADKSWHARLYYDDCVVKLVTMSGGEHPKAIDYIADVPLGGVEGDERIGHPGGEILLRHLAIDGKPYGTPLHMKAFGPQDAITKISATNLSNVDSQGFAQRWALADPLAEIDDDIDDDFGTDDSGNASAIGPDGMTAPTTGTSRMRTIPGAIALLRGIKEVGTFEATGSDDFLKNLDWYVRVMAVATGTPLFEFDLNGEQPSGEARRRAEGRSNRKARKVQRAAERFIRGIAETTLSLVGVSGGITVVFEPLETSTDTEGLELVSLKVKNGVPIRTALVEAGYTTNQVDSWWPESTPGITVDMLAIVASALASLGQAKTLGVISDVELAEMLPTILTGARNEGAPATGG